MPRVRMEKPSALRACQGLGEARVASKISQKRRVSPAKVRAELFWHLVSLGFLAVIPYYPLVYLHSFGKSVKKSVTSAELSVKAQLLLGGVLHNERV